MNSLWILQVTLEGWGDYKLVAYKPIPLRRYYPNQHYLCITGPTSVIYGSSGEPNYYRDPYRIWLAPRENNVEVSGKWSIFVP
jgi:steroid 5-alpha reductase family enzyme